MVEPSSPTPLRPPSASERFVSMAGHRSTIPNWQVDATVGWMRFRRQFFGRNCLTSIDGIDAGGNLRAFTTLLLASTRAMDSLSSPTCTSFAVQDGKKFRST